MEIIIFVLFILPILLLILVSINYINVKKRFEVLEDKILSYGKEFSKIEKAFSNVEEDLSSTTLSIISNHKKYQQLYNDMYKTKYRNKQNI